MMWLNGFRRFNDASYIWTRGCAYLRNSLGQRSISVATGRPVPETRHLDLGPSLPAGHLDLKPITGGCHYQCIRTNMRIQYNPSATKRINKHGLEKRLSSPSQIQVLWRRFLKGRHVLSVYDRFLNKTVEKKSKKRLNLHDPVKGYRKIKSNRGPEYFKF